MKTQPWYAPDRAPDEIIGDATRPYILRWHLFRKWSKLLENVYIHCVKRSDDDRALHCHPWWSISVILRTGYWEVMPVNKKLYAEWDPILARLYPGMEHMHRAEKRVWRGPGTIIFRRADAIHRLQLKNNSPDVWTLFITGPKVKEWGFYCLKGFKHWKEFGRTGCN